MGTTRTNGRLARRIACVAAAGTLALWGCAGLAGLQSASAEGDQASYDPPAVRTAGNGVQVQSCPDWNYTSKLGDGWSNFETVNYNTYYLNANEKGCSTCHSDLAETVMGGAYADLHPKLTNDLGIEYTVQQCLSCHSETRAINPDTNLGDVIHGIHQGKADCLNCHAATNDGQGMQLWDLVKHQKYRGITSIPAENMEQSFAYRIDEVLDNDAMFDMNWRMYEIDVERYFHVKADDPVDESLYEEWTITVDGEVDNPVELNLADMIANAPSETRLMKSICLANALGGSLVGQVEVTGIPLEWIVDQAGVKDNGHAVRVKSGTKKGSERYLEYCLNHDALLVYKINGQTLTWREGFPCILMCGGVAADFNIRSVTGITIMEKLSNEYYAVSVDDESAYATTPGSSEGKVDFSGNYFAKPAIGIFDLYEGEIVKVGEPLTIRGYADGYDKRIEAVEISMDGGATWSRFDTPDTNTEQWVTWEYTFTPSDETSYLFAVRAVAEDGSVTPTQYGGLLEKLIVAKHLVG